MNDFAKLPHPASPEAPKFWRFEQGSELKPAIFAYLEDKPLTVREIAVISSYLTQWIASPVWDLSPSHDMYSRNTLLVLRATAPRLAEREDIDEWLMLAIEQGIDPL